MPMTWMRLEMTATEAQGQYEAIQESFYAAFVGAGLPKNAAMYSSAASATENAFYFSPEANVFLPKVLGMRKAQPCPQPSQDMIVALVINAN